MPNFNDAPEQKEFVSGPIPPKSIVLVKMKIRDPKEDKKCDKHPLFSKSDKGNYSLDCEFEVIKGQFAGFHIWQHYVVEGKSDKAINISRAFFRAALEAARNIDPKDTSPGAIQARQLKDWSDLNGLCFPVLVGIKDSRPGDQYINNSIDRVITPDKPEYQEIGKLGEIITNNPIPPIPQPAATTEKQWGGTTSAAPTQEPPPPTQGNIPPWAQ